MLKFLRLFYFVFIPIITFGQADEKFNVSGSVICLNNGKSIPYASITIAKLRGIISDSLGNFNIVNLSKGEYTFHFSALGYPNKDTTIYIDRNVSNFKIEIFIDCNSRAFNANSARQDIADEQPKLLLVGSVAPIIYKEDKKFAKKYKIVFYDFGCTPDYIECIDAYSKIIFEHLDKLYGLKWRKEVRQDVTGIKE